MHMAYRQSQAAWWCAMIECVEILAPQISVTKTLILVFHLPMKIKKCHLIPGLKRSFEGALLSPNTHTKLYCSFKTSFFFESFVMHVSLHIRLLLWYLLQTAEHLPWNVCQWWFSSFQISRISKWLECDAHQHKNRRMGMFVCEWVIATTAGNRQTISNSNCILNEDK